MRETRNEGREAQEARRPQPGIHRKHTHLNGERAPAGAELEDAVAGLEARGAEDVVDLAHLRGLEVARRGAAREVAAHAALFVAPERAGVHHFFAEECLRERERPAKGA